MGDEEKEIRVNELRWEYYLKYLKTKNRKIGEIMDQLYNNNFDYSKLEPTVLEDYLDKITDIRLRMLFDNGMSYEKASEHIIKNYGEYVVITDEVGNGIVPIDKTERDFREWIGRVQVLLAKEADEVIRVICGIGHRIK